MKKYLTYKKIGFFILMICFFTFIEAPLRTEAAGYKWIAPTRNQVKIGQYTVKKTECAIFSKKGSGKYKRIALGQLDSSILYNGTYIYYIVSNDRLACGFLKRIRVDGKEKKDILTIRGYDSSDGDLLGIYNNRIYYNKTEHITCCYNLKTKKGKKVAEGISPGTMKYYKNSIYYMDFATEATPHIRFIKMGLDGEHKKLLERGVLSFKFIKNKIYYVKYIWLDEQGYGIEDFCRCGLNGKAKKILVNNIKETIYRYDDKNIWYSYWDEIKNREYRFKQNIRTGKITRLK